MRVPAGPRRGPLPVSVLLPVLLAALPVAMAAGVAVGSVGITLSDTTRILAHLTAPGLVEPTWSRAHETIVVRVRLPRMLLAAVVGAGLALTGQALQAVVRNPLADPLLLGVSSGATFGAVLVGMSGFAAFGLYSLQVSAFLGALLALLVVYSLARSRGRVAGTRLVLAGVVTGQVLTSMSSLVIMVSGDPHAAEKVNRWTLGGLGGATWEMLPLPACAVLLVLAVLALRTRALNVLALGEEAATAMGLTVHRFRAGMFVLASLAVGVVVSVSGGIGFVGLMMPHIARFLVGPDHRRALPVASVLGAVFLVLADLAARTLASPEEIPVGVLTALCGAPFFLWLMRRSARDPGG